MGEQLQESWYALKTAQKREALAVAVLAGFEGVEAFCPRIRYRRKTRAGWQRVTEALFPGYAFARFAYEAHYLRVRSAQGVTGLVSYGGRHPVIPDHVIASLRGCCDDSAMVEVATPELGPGDTVEVTVGPLAGMQAVVQRVMPARERICILVDFLGRTLEADFKAEELEAVCEQSPAAAAFSAQP